MISFLFISFVITIHKRNFFFLSRFFLHDVIYIKTNKEKHVRVSIKIFYVFYANVVDNKEKNR
jgi:hypothetical protein